MALNVWKCKSCNLYNSYLKNKCQACFTVSQLPPFKLSQDLPCSDLLNIIISTSEIGNKSGYLISFESDQTFMENNGFNFMITLAKNLAKKPKSKPKIFKDPFMPPFDIGAHVTDLNDQYRILLNKYNVVPNHILIITKQFVKQTLPLIPMDFDIIFKVILSMDGLCYFNSGPFSGASQPHKHIQIIPNVYKFPIEQFIKNIKITNDINDINEQKENEVSYNLYSLQEYSSFIHRVYLIDNMNNDNNNNLCEVYCLMINEIKNDIKRCGYEQYLHEDKFSYNMILTTDYMFIVGRKNNDYFDEKLFGKDVNISVNGVTFAGTFFCKSEQSLSMLKQVGAFSVLDFVTFQQK